MKITLKGIITVKIQNQVKPGQIDDRTVRTIGGQSGRNPDGTLVYLLGQDCWRAGRDQ